MCDPITMMAISVGTQALGSAVSGGTASKNAAAVSAANNRVLRETLDKNKPEQEAARKLFDDQMAGIDFGGQLSGAQANKRADYRANLSEAPVVETGRSTPKFLKDQFAQRLADSFARAGGMADRQGDVAGYSQMFADNAFDNRQNVRDANLYLDRIGGNLSILPDQQQFATARVTPAFDWGQVISGVGKIAGGMGGGNVVSARGPTNIVPRGY